MATKRRKADVKAPDYRNNPTGFSISVYDIQGDPIAPGLKEVIAQYVENTIKSMKLDTLAVNVTE